MNTLIEVLEEHGYGWTDLGELQKVYISISSIETVDDIEYKNLFKDGKRLDDIEYKNLFKDGERYIKLLTHGGRNYYTKLSAAQIRGIMEK